MPFEISWSLRVFHFQSITTVLDCSIQNGCFGLNFMKRKMCLNLTEKNFWMCAQSIYFETRARNFLAPLWFHDFFAHALWIGLQNARLKNSWNHQMRSYVIKAKKMRNNKLIDWTSGFNKLENYACTSDFFPWNHRIVIFQQK